MIRGWRIVVAYPSPPVPSALTPQALRYAANGQRIPSYSSCHDAIWPHTATSSHNLFVMQHSLLSILRSHQAWPLQSQQQQCWYDRHNHVMVDPVTFATSADHTQYQLGTLDPHLQFWQFDVLR